MPLKRRDSAVIKIRATYHITSLHRYSVHNAATIWRSAMLHATRGYAAMPPCQNAILCPHGRSTRGAPSATAESGQQHSGGCPFMAGSPPPVKSRATPTPKVLNRRTPRATDHS
ncbi:hypothetical protein AVEN_47733-1 [Araneus ventricosus]|uniref:Uncharacterized protein n=1 Tax=Araneus ventricosus TaxID=182803 RepID=A0A4Y2W1B2_ARAVE|nr:hypothetical protein AVEN_47733-1 [Araneus ventricosus]